MPEGYKIRVRVEVLRSDGQTIKFEKFELDAPVEKLLEIDGNLYQYVDEFVDDEGTYCYYEPAVIRKVSLDV